MALKTLHFVQGLSRTPLLFIPRYLTNIFFENMFQETNLENRKSENLKFQKPRFTNRSPVYRYRRRLSRISRTNCFKHTNKSIAKYVHAARLLVHLWEKTNQLTFQDRLLIFSYFQLSVFCFWKIFSETRLVRYRGINNKGVLERPWTTWRVLRAISTTLKCQFTGKC